LSLVYDADHIQHLAILAKSFRLLVWGRKNTADVEIFPPVDVSD